MTLLVERVPHLIGGDEFGNLCRCCGRAHAIQHDADCPVPAVLDVVQRYLDKPT